MIEIGLWVGNSAVLWAEALRSSQRPGQIICIDAWKPYIPIKSSSQQMLPRLAEGSIDMVYIDGDHSYAGIMHDLAASTRLLVEGGIICGDDFDIDINMIDLAYALANKEVNDIVDPKTNRQYHPGVCLAINDFFKGKVSHHHGFWAMRKVAGQWFEIEPAVFGI